MNDNDFGAPVIQTPANSAHRLGSIDALAWQFKADLPEATSRVAGVFDSTGNFHAVCGNDNSHISSPYDEIWNPDGNHWTRGLTHPSGRYGVHNHDVARIGSVIYVGGGSQGSNGYYNSLTAIDLTANTWTVKTAMPQNSFLYYSFGAAGGEIYCLGGYNQASVLNTNYRYDPTANRWMPRARMPAARRCAMVAVIGDTIHVFGGFSRNDLTSGTTTHWKYNWVTNTWVQGTSLPTDLAWGRAVVVSTPDSGAMVYLLGGVNGGNATSQVYRYSQRFDNWTHDGNLLAATRSQAAGANDHRILVAGGYAHGLLSATQDAELSTSMLDAQAVSIDAPTGTQPSGAVIAPQATVRNNGTTSQSFDVRFTISDGYSDTRNVTLAPDSQQVVTFNNWTASIIGTWVTKCTTMLSGDANPANDMVRDSVIVQASLLDAQTVSIDAPTGTQPSGAVIAPEATVRNNSTAAQTFQVRFTVSDGYTDIRSVTLAPDSQQVVTFNNWTASIIGTWVTKCTTMLIGDADPANDMVHDSVIVMASVPDVQVLSVDAPVGAVSQGTLITPEATVTNNGTTPLNFDVRFVITPGYTDQKNVTVVPHMHQQVSFANWVAGPLGWLATKCTALVADPNPSNNRVSDSVFVQFVDAAATAILAPIDTVDSGTVTAPRATVRNYGSQAETFDVRFSIGATYTSTRTVTALAPDSSLNVDFDNWTATAPGTFATQCTTLLVGDQIPGNDATNGSVVVRQPVGAGDVGTTAILKPLGAYDSLQSDTPQAVVHNYGASTATFPVQMTIAPTYASTKTVTALAPGADRTVNFDVWPARARGTWSVRCSTMLSGDEDPSNNAARDSVTVNVHDIAAVSIVAPKNSIPIESIIPQTRIHNSGTLRDSLTVTFKVLEDSFVSFRNLPDGIPVGHDTIIDFDVYYAGIPGGYTTKCSTWSRKDQFAPNNTVDGQFSVAMNDVGVAQVLAPLGTFDTSVVLTPRGEFHNWGILPATFHAYCRLLTDSGAAAYRDSITVANLQVGADTTLTFATWAKPHAAGNYSVRCSTWLSGDANTSNDTLSGTFTITSAQPEVQWLSMPPIPTKPKVKNVKDGGALAWGKGATDADDTGYVYAFKGNGTYEFYRYNTISNAWLSRDSIPAIGHTSKKKAVKKGSGLVVDADGKVYGTKGNNTLEFWCYDPTEPAGQHWTQLGDVPPGSKALKEGTGLAAVDISGTSYIYLLKGSGTKEFYRYKVSDGSWATMADALGGFSTKPYKNGSSITYDNNDTIWCMKGSYNELFAYSVSGNIWVTKDTLPKKSPPSAKKTKVKDGSQVAYSDRAVYVLKGNNTNEFWTYKCDSHAWYVATPLLDGPKKVKGGGALVCGKAPSALYALRGNNTLEFWKYAPVSADLFAPSASHDFNDVQGQSALRSSEFALRIAPNPFTPAISPLISYSLPRAGNITLALYDVSGRLVSTLASGYHPAGSYSCSLLATHYSLAAGVYLLKFETEGCTTTSKLIIE
jgi:hypothetical protein